ncbi:MAG: ATP-binding protein [Chitinophagales bacterium]
MYYQRTPLSLWLKEGEGPNLDFKVSITSRPKIARSIVAFANSRGGKIIVGVEDNKRVVGADIGGEEYELEKAAALFCQPAIELEFEEYETSTQKMLLIAHVPESKEKPHYCIDRKGRKKIYVRIADECVVPTTMIAEMLKSGYMNKLERNHYYTIFKNELVSYLKKNKRISVSEYMKLKNCSERNAKRTLLDLLFEGVLQINGKEEFLLK